jgi:hypothetical protein
MASVRFVFGIQRMSPLSWSTIHRQECWANILVPDCRVNTVPGIPSCAHDIYRHRDNITM